MNKNQKLELTWIGKDQRPKLEPRILVEDLPAAPGAAQAGPAKSYHAPFRTGKSDIFDNRLIFGDNLLALKALEQEFAGKVKCVFIDPPYNTGSAFSHYDDGVEHSLWLSLMRDRIELLRRLLAKDGSLWITIDDTESHYLKVMCDEVFGREHFVANVIWWKKSSPQSNAVWLSDSHDHVLVYAKDKIIWRPNKLLRTEEQNAIYKHSDEFDGIDEKGNPYGRGPWFPGDLTISLASGQRGKQYAKTGHTDNIYEIVTPSGRTVLPAKGRAWAYIKTSYERLKAEHRIYFGREGRNKPCIKRFLSEIAERGVVPMTTWHYDEVGENRTAMQEILAFNPDDPFSTPKPEALLGRILTIGSNRGDLVLDSFAGSGTTGAVAHKMGRRWIMVELGEHCHTHIIPRLKKLIDGEDKGGITEAAGWKGGGGFRYYRLGPSLLQKDEFGNWVISKEYNPAMLAEAMCKLEGFTYAPSDTAYWQHGHSTETDFMYVTTQTLTREQLQKLSDEVGESRSLLVMCGAFRVKNLDEFPNLTVKKIPKAVLTRCEWGKDDYSLEIKNLPMKEPEEENRQDAKSAKGPRTKEERRRRAPAQSSLFD